MLSLFIRNLFFTILQPGIVAGLLPFYIMGSDARNKFYGQPWSIIQDTGLLLFFIGVILLTWCIIAFAIKGKGTLSPADPTKKLVVTGLYRFSRNPMYVGVSLILLGETIFFQSTALLIYSIVIITAFNIFIIFFEEPRLEKDFGEDYAAYRKKVRRWI